MKLICINDKNRPNEVPKSHWVKEGQEYTLLEVCKLNAMPKGNDLGVKIKEIDLSPFAPFIYFSASRFKGVVDYEMIDVNEKIEEALV